MSSLDASNHSGVDLPAAKNEMQVNDRFTAIWDSWSTRDALEAPRTLPDGTKG